MAHDIKTRYKLKEEEKYKNHTSYEWDGDVTADVLQMKEVMHSCLFACLYIVCMCVARMYIYMHACKQISLRKVQDVFCFSNVLNCFSSAIQAR